MQILQDPLVIHTKLPDAEEGLEVYTEQLGYYDMKEVGKVVEMTPPEAGETTEPAAEGQGQGQGNANAGSNTGGSASATTGTTSSAPSAIGTAATRPDSNLQQETSEVAQANTQGQATIHVEQGDPAQMAALVPIVIQRRDMADDEQQSGESYVAYIQPTALDAFARHSEVLSSANNRRDIDVHKVAHEVYRQIKRRLATERERGRV